MMLDELECFLTSGHHDRMRCVTNQLGRRAHGLHMRKHLAVFFVNTVHDRCHVVTSGLGKPNGRTSIGQLWAANVTRSRR